MSVLIRATLCGLLSLMLAGAPVSAAPPEGKGNPHAHGGKPQKHQPSGKKGSVERAVDGHDAAQDLIRAGITAAAVQAIIREHHIDIGGYASLPPGIRKNLARGKPLPPGIAKRAVPLPLLNELPRHPGYEWQVAGRDLVLVAIGTAIIADVLQGIFD